jgi:hypothetical protein
MPTPVRSRQDSPGIRRKPTEAAREQVLGLYVLPYEALRRAADPDQQLLQFLHFTYMAVAGARHWTAPRSRRFRIGCGITWPVNLRTDSLHGAGR